MAMNFQQLLIFLLAVCCTDVSLGEERVYRVAFVLSGSSRSFEFPFVHETIRWNLISKFCPKVLCKGDIFIRISTTDNIHDGVGFNSSGLLLKSEERSFSKIKNALSHLNVGGLLEVDWTDIGSEKEESEMHNSFPFSSRHKIFRKLDPRRYSMYFNRWAAYQLMLKEEKKSGKQYDWVVHSRLDAVWGAPMLDVSTFTSDAVIVPDSWASEVPDTFALLPRKWSDVYYSLDQLLLPGVFCLGGGNFHPDTLKAAYLINNLHFKLAEVVEAQQADCDRLHRAADPRNVDAALNISWSEEGISEQILKRKLGSAGIRLDKNNLLYRPFFMVIVRPQNDEDMCLYLHPRFMIGWVRPTQLSQLSLWLACTWMMHEMRALHAIKYSTCKVKNNRYIGNSCILNLRLSKFNFMPLRLHKSDKCLEGVIDGGGTIKTRKHILSKLNPNHDVTLKPCQQSEIVSGVQTHYYYAQMFHFYPHMSRPQNIRVVSSSITPILRCLTVVSEATAVILKPCIEEREREEARETHRKDPLHSLTVDPERNMQLFTVHIMRAQSSQKGKRTVYIQIYWVSQSNETYCVTELQGQTSITLKLCQQINSEYLLLSTGAVNHKREGARRGQWEKAREGGRNIESDPSVFILERISLTIFK